MPESVKVLLNHKLLTFNVYDESEVHLVFENQKPQIIKVLIGADGYNSAIRAITVGDGAPLYTGTMSLRGILKLEDIATKLPEAAWAFPFLERRGFMMIVGQRKNFWIMDSGPGLLAWTTTAERASPEKSSDAYRAALEGFDTFPDLAKSLIRATDPAAIVETGVCDRLPVDQWYALLTSSDSFVWLREKAC